MTFSREGLQKPDNGHAGVATEVDDRRDIKAAHRPELRLERSGEEKGITVFAHMDRMSEPLQVQLMPQTAKPARPAPQVRGEKEEGRSRPIAEQGGPCIRRDTLVPCEVKAIERTSHPFGLLIIRKGSRRLRQSPHRSARALISACGSYLG